MVRCFSDGLTLTAVPSRHESGRGLFDGSKSLWNGYVFEFQGKRFYNSGDGAFDGHFAAIKQRFGEFDIAFIENGQYSDNWFSHMQPIETLKAAEIIRAKRFMPIHWGMYPLSTHQWNAPVLHTVPLARQRNLNPLTPIFGQVFDENSESRDWWK
ncbi:metal-dependent hydrolase [Kingella potus]|uniref:Metal-dependent hydrolase n=1 Tax=Kingella potus TaxID=265175 RepID=A0A377QWZ0_9NEIS|nr:MBL fold metallo-hydrolase [Kingella potus]UOP01774.1 MBL fold metallo-hydrolase [Kingella potus]STQ99916.1 metal-dependent hydrolase [Kingella potus]